MKRSLFCVMLLVLALASCRRHSQDHVSSNAPVVKIAVFADGRLTVDGSPATVDSLRTSLKHAAEAQGIVWYYREAGQQEPPPVAMQVMQVMQVIAEARLPVRLSSRPDYSDAIGPDGRSVTP
jgi:biopolymer transport protein ExbD